MKVGTLFINEYSDREVTEYFEVAAWYETRELEPGKYDIKCKNYRDVNHFIASVPCVVTGSCYTSHYGGIPYGEGQVDTNVGARKYHKIIWRGDSEFARAVVTPNPVWKIVLEEDLAVVARPFSNHHGPFMRYELVENDFGY